MYKVSYNVYPPFQDPFSPGVNYSITLLLRREPEILPRSILLHNHPEARAMLNIIHGSGHFQVDHVTSPHQPIVALKYSPDQTQITLRPLDEGQVPVTVTDLCLEVDTKTVAMVTVAAPHSIHVTVADKVQVGNWMLAHVRVLDNRGNVFSTDQLRYAYICHGVFIF